MQKQVGEALGSTMYEVRNKDIYDMKNATAKTVAFIF